MTDIDKKAAARSLARINMNFEHDDIIFKTYWFRVLCEGEYSWNYKEHSHSFYELHMCLKGSCEFYSDGNLYKLKEKDFIIIPPKTKHHIEKVSPKLTKFGWAFSAQSKSLNNDLLDLWLGSASGGKVYHAPDAISREIEFIENSALEKELLYRTLIYDGAFRLFVLFLRSIAENPPQIESCTEEQTDMRGLAIQSYILDNLAGGISIADLARQFYLSEKQISRIVKSSFGKTFGELKRSLQTQEVCNLIADTDKSLKEIALLSGFSDEYSMSKVFKKEEGMSPGLYRKGIKEP
ncbi:MAG: AraC family transcriptional regulator [Bacillota bacterium]|nr:AraC family transcriptional regulator [Bacillota bacterium]